MAETENEEKIESIEETVKEEIPKEAEEVQEKPNDSTTKDVSESDRLIANQAARYMQILNLEKNIFEDGVVTNEEAARIDFCKAQVLLQLVSTADYGMHLPDNHPHKRASDVLLKHLYKCYDKVEEMQEKAQKQAVEKRYNKDIAYAMLSSEARAQRLAEGEILADFDLMPPSKTINLTGIPLSMGTVSMLSQLIHNPTESIKSQMPLLIEELGKRILPADKQKSVAIIGTLLTGLTGMKSEKAMTDALEGKNLAANILSIVGGKSI